MPSVVTHKVQDRCKRALTAAHYLANLMDPRYRGINLSKDEVDAGLELCSLDYTSCLPTVINFRAVAGPFKSFMFTEEVLKAISPLTWWESQKSTLESDVIVLCRKILGGVASSAGVERIFSTFGFVHSKVRNRLGRVKAGKLVFLYKLLNTHK
ncbi:Transposase [Oopsacas minuta]|uniref:Transposase n=1 Tax=Oopsacas minuta TaxID=111878 RepID=A0AAV7JI74_9METZ|nr:Transposase [Oopsacas minuta]